MPPLNLTLTSDRIKIIAKLNHTPIIHFSYWIVEPWGRKKKHTGNVRNAAAQLKAGTRPFSCASAARPSFKTSVIGMGLDIALKRKGRRKGPGKKNITKKNSANQPRKTESSGLLYTGGFSVSMFRLLSHQRPMRRFQPSGKVAQGGGGLHKADAANTLA